MKMKRDSCSVSIGSREKFVPKKKRREKREKVKEEKTKRNTDSGKKDFVTASLIEQVPSDCLYNG